MPLRSSVIAIMAWVAALLALAIGHDQVSASIFAASAIIVNGCAPVVLEKKD